MSKWSALPFDGAGMSFGSPHDIRTVTKVWGRAGGVEGEGWRGRPSTGAVLYLHRCYYPGGLFLKDEAVKVAVGLRRRLQLNVQCRTLTAFHPVYTCRFA